MKNTINPIKKVLSALFNTRASGVYFILFAGAIAVATFIENDYGTSSAQKVIFKSWWFELLLILFCISIVVNIIKYKMVQQKKWALFLFHSAIIVIVLGAGITRYIGFEGIMHIRENDKSSSFLSADTHLKFEVKNNKSTYNFDEPVLFASLGNNYWKESYLVTDDLIEFEVTNFIPNPKQELVSSNIDGKPILKVVFAGANGREEYFIAKGQTKKIKNVLYNFKEETLVGAFNIKYENKQLSFKTNRAFIQTVMATRKTDTLQSSTYHPLRLRSMYTDGVNSFVFGEFIQNGVIQINSESPKVKSESRNALVMNVSVNGIQKETYVYGNKGLPGIPSTLMFEDLNISISYGAKEMTVPFSIKLNEFILEKYPGTNSASSYASEVTLADPQNNVTLDYRIFMNNILNYDGYRFFQSSFDRDEKGTYLSVNNDYWGTLITYIGYALLTLGMLFVFFSKKTRFFKLRQNIYKLRSKSGTFILVLSLMLSTFSFAQSNFNVDDIVSKEHADAFSKVVVQDFKGRMKPIHTFSRELLRKIHRKESFEGLTADQVLLSMFVNKENWYIIRLLKLGKHQDIQKMLGVSGSYASYRDFFNDEGKYKLRDEVSRIYSLKPIDRGVYEKELLKIDERLNILGLMFSGSLLKIVPNPSDPNNTWQAYGGHNHNSGSSKSGVAENFFNSYGANLKKAIASNDYKHVGHLLDELKTYQFDKGGSIMPSVSKINSEIFLNNLNVFTRLAGLYMILGLALLFFLFLSVFKPNLKLNKIYIALFSLVLVGFILHTVGLSLRWYISGRAPWSNGYESMIYIAWTSTLAGVLFTRKSFGGLAATMVLAATILFVSTLSFLDPEITPLVPVLKSYWLTIHVSLEAGSYGFLMLGAIIGLINLFLMVFITETNKVRVKRIVQEMSYISELTLIGGLFMVSIGTYLGGIWANESWGRYWGWDAKETWALVTILVYAFILHMRFLPKLKGLFAYNLATIFGLASVLMTYYGVNYYLSGLHSYATGDPVPVPNWVYIVVICIVALSFLAYFRKRKYKIIS